MVLPLPLGPSRPKISARFDGEIQALQRGVIAVAVVEIFNLNHRVGHHNQ